MQIHQIKRRVANKTTKIVGRGGKRGKQSGKGTKGQNARGGRKKYPEIRQMIKKIPRLRGRGKNSLKTFQIKPIGINLGELNTFFPQGGKVTPQALIRVKLLNYVAASIPRVKILAGGEITKKYEVMGCTVSAKAKEMIVKMGGSVA